MSKFKGLKPAAQPRSIRSIAETNTGDFPDEANVQPGGEYIDEAEKARPTGSRGTSAADPQPITNLKRG